MRIAMLFSAVAATSALNVTFEASWGAFPSDAYLGLRAAIAEATSPLRTAAEVCMSHSQQGAEELLRTAQTHSSTRCRGGIILLAAAPTPNLLHGAPAVLTIGAELDGVLRFSAFAVARHRSFVAGSTLRRFAVIRGATHHSFSDGGTLAPVPATDLQAKLDAPTVHGLVAALISEWLGHTTGNSLSAGEAAAAQLSAPIVHALELEGSNKLGHPWCNSDFPTNPTCQYPKFPDHALPPGPAGAPNPLPPADCICGSTWVAEYANPMLAGLEEAPIPGAKLTSKDAFHDVSDTHPFHLPHIFNECKSPDGCVLNTTTLTMPVYQDSPLFPNQTAPPLSIFEFRAKLKSRQAMWEAAGLGSQDKSKTDANLTMCRAINEQAWAWALANAETSVRQRFEQEGEPFVMVDDKVAPIGVTGPEWIKDALVYTRSGNSSRSVIEIQSWQFVVGNTNDGHVPWIIPAGMHYCKLLSPARAMEWIYTDGLRRSALLERGIKVNY